MNLDTDTMQLCLYILYICMQVYTFEIIRHNYECPVKCKYKSIYVGIYLTESYPLVYNYYIQLYGVHIYTGSHLLHYG